MYIWNISSHTERQHGIVVKSVRLVTRTPDFESPFMPWKVTRSLWASYNLSLTYCPKDRIIIINNAVESDVNLLVSPLRRKVQYN